MINMTDEEKTEEALETMLRHIHRMQELTDTMDQIRMDLEGCDND
jgi:hypothetical protein